MRVIWVETRRKMTQSSLTRNLRFLAFLPPPTSYADYTNMSIPYCCIILHTVQHLR